MPTFHATARVVQRSGPPKPRPSSAPASVSSRSCVPRATFSAPFSLRTCRLALPGWELVPYYQPAHEVGGDFYDYFALEDGRVGIVIGDVTDKGIPAALVMTANGYPDDDPHRRPGADLAR